MDYMAHKTEKGWNATKAIGILLVVVGVIVALFSVYSMLTGRSSFGMYHRGNFTRNFTSSQFNSSLSPTFRRAGGLGFGSPDVIVIGILLVILGLVTYKYGSLKLQMK